MKTIEIVPAGSGWMIRSDVIKNELLFRSGASAESAAVRLGQGLADAGESSQISVFIRDGSLARQFIVRSLRRTAPPLALVEHA